MAAVRYSPLAELDLDLVADYSRAMWGVAQADKYMSAMEAACEQLAANPLLGRIHRGALVGVRRMEQGSHVIFYETQADGVLVGRILHKAMLPSLHGM